MAKKTVATLQTGSKKLSKAIKMVKSPKTGAYIFQEKIPIVPLYFAKIRPIIKRNNMLIMVDDDRLELKQNEKIEQIQVRFRTLGCYPLTAAVESSASSVEEILIELLETKHSERQGRLIDNDQIGSMERKKQEGYF